MEFDGWNRCYSSCSLRTHNQLEWWNWALNDLIVAERLDELNELDVTKDHEELDELDVAKGLDELNNLVELDNQLEAVIETTWWRFGET